jgi:hypothetical protein
VTSLTDTAILHPVEVDLLCAFADVEAPFPLDVPSVGTTDRERRMLFGAAREQLTARGLADDRGPCGVAESFVRLLRTATGTLDLVLANGSATVGAVVLVDGESAVLATQRPDQPGQTVAMRAMPLDHAVGELVTMVPMLGPAAVPAFTLPMRPLRRMFDAMTARLPGDNRPAQPFSVSEMDDLLYECGIDEQFARRLTSTLRPVIGSGQAGATQRESMFADWRRIAREIRWVDTPRGRVRLSGGDTQTEPADWISVNPFTQHDIRTALRELAAHLRD